MSDLKKEPNQFLDKQVSAISASNQDKPFYDFTSGKQEAAITILNREMDLLHKNLFEREL